MKRAVSCVGEAPFFSGSGMADQRMWVKPAWLVAGAVGVGLLLLGGVFLLYDRFAPPYGKLILAAYVAVWVAFTVLLCVPAAVIAQAARNKRYGVFSHLKQATTKKEVRGGTNVAEKR